MSRASFPCFRTTRVAGTIVLAHMVSTCAIYAMDKPSEDRQHDQVMRKLCQHHGLNAKDFTLPKGDQQTTGQKVPLFDINNSSQKTHKQQLLHIQKVAPDLLTAQAQQKLTQLQTILVEPLEIQPMPGSSAKSSSISASLGSIIYSPVSLISWAYNNAPTLRFSSKPATVSPTSSTPDAPQNINDGTVVAEKSVKDGSSSSSTSSKEEKSAPTILPTTEVSAQESSSGSKTNEQQIIFDFDGGGGRGYMEALWVQYLERKWNKPVSKIATTISGTSIGGIIALGLTIKKEDGTPCMSGAQIVSFFDDKFDIIFPQTSKWDVPMRVWNGVSSLFYTQYDEKPLVDLAQQYFGQATFSSSLCDVMVTSVDSLTNNPFIMTNISHPTMLAWEGARATSAAPTKLRAYKPKSIAENVMLVDGAFLANNPAFHANLFTMENAKLRGQSFNPVVLSMGTGILPTMPIPSDAGKLNGASAIVETFLAAGVKGTEMTMSSLLKPGETYIRINPRFDEYVPMDEFKQHKSLLTSTAEYAYDALDQFSDSDAVRRKLEATD